MAQGHWWASGVERPIERNVPIKAIRRRAAAGKMDGSPETAAANWRLAVSNQSMGAMAFLSSSICNNTSFAKKFFFSSLLFFERENRKDVVLTHVKEWGTLLHAAADDDKDL